MVTDEEIVRELQTLRKEVQVLNDKEEIRDVLARYGQTFDQGRYDRWYDLWTEDAVFITNNPVTGTDQKITGKDALKATFGSSTKVHSTMQHLQLGVVIKVDGDNATAIGYQLMTSHKGEKPEVSKTGGRSWKLRRVNGKWLISEGVSRNQNDEKSMKDLIPERW